MHARGRLSLSTTALTLGMLAAAGVLASAVVVRQAGAASFTVVNGQTETATQTLNADETGTVEAGGVLSTVGSAVSATGDRAVIDNAGSVSTSGNNARGVFSNGDDARITNSGRVSTSASGADGIFSDGDNARIVNSGAISTLGIGADGIFAAGPDARVVNSGTILTSGDQGRGIFAAGLDAQVVNSGTISTSGESADGIRATRSGAQIVNSGTIGVRGVGAFGVYLAGGAGTSQTLTNFGTISATGAAATAIAGLSGAQTLHFQAGSNIIGNIDLGDGADVINIDGATRIAGTIDLGAGTDSAHVNVSPGASSVFTFLNAETVTLGAAVPGVVIGNRVITVDATGQAAAQTALTGVVRAAHAAIGGRGGISASAPANHLALGYADGGAPDTFLPFAGMPGERTNGLTVWGDVFGGRLERGGDGAALAYDQNYGGIVTGLERDTGAMRLGVSLGAARSAIATDARSIDTDVDTVFAGLYGAGAIAANLTLSASLLAGYERHDNARAVFDGPNVETASAEFDNWFVSPSLGLEYDYALSETLRLRPSARAIYTASFYDGYTESGAANANLTVSGRDVNTLNARAQLALAYEARGMALEARAGFDGRYSDADDVRARLAGNALRFAPSGDDSVNGGFFGLSAQIAPSERLTLAADAELRGASGNEREFSGKVRAVYRF